MKTSKKTVSVTLTLLLAIVLLSWDFNKGKKEIPKSDASVMNEAYSPANVQMMSFIEGADRYNNPGAYQLPGAEDVLIKKIPGDNNHLLIMAYYSKENFSRPSFTIENGYSILFKDDGMGYDEKAGDGLYTARIDVDVKEFRQKAINMVKQMKEDGYKPFRYVNREYVYDPEVENTFSTQTFDANKAVSIAGITNGLSGGTSKETLMDKIKKNSIFITDLSVVEDTTRTWNFCTQKGNVNGVWTFGGLMRQLASKDPQHIATDAELSVFVKNWLNSWLTTQIVNGDTIAVRTLMNSLILNPWLNASRAAGSPVGQLDMHFAPFRLTAIVNRFDLRSGSKFSEDNQFCGQGRFMFCLIRSDCSTSLTYTTIIEYAINKPNTCEAKKDWAQQWFNLTNLTRGSPEYNQALQNITDQYSLCGTTPTAINQSSIAQLRTNDLALSPSPRFWELREFTLDSSGALVQSTVGQTPADKYNGQVANDEVKRMVAFVNQNRSAITNGTYGTPLQWQGFGFLGGSSKILGQPTGLPPKVYHWDGLTDSTNKPFFIASNTARGNFSFETCSGCHSGETQTNFTHVDTAFFGHEATLSGFLTGKAGFKGVDFDGDSTNSNYAVKDPALRPSATNPTIKTFNDIQRRASDLKAVVNTACGSVLGISSELMFKPVNMVH